VRTAWHRSAGRAAHPDFGPDLEVDPATLRRAVARMDELSQRWQALPVGGSLVLAWPAELTVDVAGMRQGRRRRVVGSGGR